MDRALSKYIFKVNIANYALQFANCNCDMQIKLTEPKFSQIDFGE